MNASEASAAPAQRPAAAPVGPEDISPVRGWRRPSVWIAATLVAVVAAGAWIWRSQQQSAAAPSYVAEAITRGNLSITVTANGTLQPTLTVNIGSELSGTVTRVLVDVNDRIKKGQVLVELDTAKFSDQVARSRATVASATAKVAQTVATVKEMESNLARLNEVARLSGGKVPSKSELDAARRRTNAHRQMKQRRARPWSIPRPRFRQTRQIYQGIDKVADRRHPADAGRGSRQRRRRVAAGGDAVHNRRRPGQDEAAGQRRRSRRRRGSSRSERLVHRRCLSNAQVPGNSHARGLRLDDHGQCGHVPHIPAGREFRPVAAPRDDGDRDDPCAAERRDVLLVPNTALRFTPTSPIAGAGEPKGAGIVSSLIPRGPARAPKAATAATGSSAARRVWVLRDGQPVAVPIEPGVSDGRMTEVTSAELQPGMLVITDQRAAAGS